MMSAADVQESLGQPSAKSSGSLFRIATLAEDRAHHAAQNPPPETGANRRALCKMRDVRLQRNVAAGTVPL